MESTLQKARRLLNYDQRNLVNGKVSSVSGSTASVLLYDGSTRTAYLPPGVEVSAGDQVQVAIAGNVAAVQGAAQLQPLAGQKTVWI